MKESVGFVKQASPLCNRIDVAEMFKHTCYDAW